MSDNKPKKIHRVQIDFSEDAYNKLLKLKEDAGAETVSDLIKDALGLYEFSRMMRAGKISFPNK